MKTHGNPVRSCLRAGAAIGVILTGLLPLCARSQITAADANLIKSGIGNRVEALTILGGDYGLSGGSYHSTGNSNVDFNISKFGGSGDVGDPQRLDGLDIGWQPR